MNIHKGTVENKGLCLLQQGWAEEKSLLRTLRLPKEPLALTSTRKASVAFCSRGCSFCFLPGLCLLSLSLLEKAVPLKAIALLLSDRIILQITPLITGQCHFRRLLRIVCQTCQPGAKARTQSKVTNQHRIPLGEVWMGNILRFFFMKK